MKTKQLVISALFLVLAHTGCREGGDTSKKTSYRDIEISAQVGEQKIFYRFPAPNDIVNYIKTERLVYLKDHLNPVSRANRYLDTRLQNFNLGVYSADFAYITVFKTLSEASEYFKATEVLAYQVGLSSIYDESMRKRVEANEANIDSLSNIARESYSNMVKHLTVRGSEKQLAIISAGGYIEVLYLAINQTENLDADYPLLRKIYDQRYGLENLSHFMSDFTDDKWMNNLYNDLQAILNAFNLVESKAESEGQVTKGKGGELNFSGGKVQLSISPSNYAKLKQVVLETREKYTNPS
jgi:hypothetical protein